jgi:hydroxymethylpyrimidine pyrophosphatase-like HAD family hydrolase
MSRYLVFEFPREDDDELIDIWLKAYSKDIVLVASQPLEIARWAIEKAQALEHDG